MSTLLEGAEAKGTRGRPSFRPVSDQDLNDPALAYDLILSAADLAKEIYGVANKKNRRRVFELKRKGRMPIFKLGGRLVARRSQLRAEIKRREQEALAGV